MKCTLCITQRCNFACEYCYIGKRDATMNVPTAQRIIDTIFERTPPDEKIDFGFFGGEPLLDFDLVKEITRLIETHPGYDPSRVEIHLVTNGSLYTDDIGDFIHSHRLGFGVSCDGPEAIQDTFRRFRDGQSSSPVVEANLRRAIATLPLVMVNAVHHPRTFRRLPQVIDYFAGLGLTQIYLSPDYSAHWSDCDIDDLPGVYDQVADQYIAYYRQGKPLNISLLDTKIAVFLRGGFNPSERCRMGRGELAFTPEGNVYPCERLIGDGVTGEHCIGNIQSGIYPERMTCRTVPGHEINPECLTCGVKEYCMNWCGCSNYMATRYYNRVSFFLCRSEQAAIQAAFKAFQILEREFGSTFCEHLSGQPTLNSIAYANFDV